MVIILIAVAVSAALQLSFIPRTGGGALYVIGMTLALTLLSLVPSMRHRRAKKAEDSPRELLASLEVAGARNTEINASREL
jgi:hypothetical protein